MRFSHPRFKHGISSVVGVAALILIFIAIIAFLLTTLYRLADLTQMMSESLRERAESESIIRVIHGVWTHENTLITINITSRYSQAILITGITIVFADGTKLILSKYNTSNNESYVVITKPDNTKTKINLQLPIALSPGHTVTIAIFNGHVRVKKILTVTITLANPSTLTTLHLNPSTP